MPHSDPNRFTTGTWIAPSVPIPVVVNGELVAVVDSDSPIEMIDGKLTEPLELHLRPDVFARWKADPTMQWGRPGSAAVDLIVRKVRGETWTDG